MKLLKNFLFILLINLYSKSIYSLRPFDIPWRSITCSIISKPYLDHLNCSIHNLPRNRGNYVTAKVQFSQDIERIILDFKVSIPGRGNRNSELIKFRSDGCHREKYNSVNPIVSALFQQLYQSSNFPKICPLKAHTIYNVENLSLNPDYFPGYTPEMNFSIKFSMYTGKIQLLTSQLVASVIKKK